VLNRRASRDLTVWVVPVLATVMVFFAFVLVFVSSPFATQVAPADGRGLNPSLQNPYMISHPIFLYLGYVGLTIPFAFAIGSLLARRTDERWIVATRRATLVAWTALGIGRTVGSKWAYEEVGWGVTQSPIGAWFLGFLTLVVVGSLALVVARLPLLRTRAKLESLVSREASFLYNNLLLVALTLTILWGVVYPIVHEAVVGESRIVGPGYCAFFLKVFGLPLLLLMGIGPLIAWDAGPPGARRRFLAGRVLRADRAEPAPLRRLCRPRRGRPARDRDRPARARTTRWPRAGSPAARRWRSVTTG